MERKLRLGVFTETLNSNSLRGANRLFQAIYQGLKERDDVEIVLLDERVPFELSPNRTIYYGRDLKDPNVSQTIDVPLEFKSGGRGIEFIFKRSFRKFRWFYSHPLAIPLRWLTRPGVIISRRILRAVARRLNLNTQEIYQVLARRRQDRVGLWDLTRALFVLPHDSFSNADIENNVFDLCDFDALVNFWWFHLSSENPMLQNMVPADLPVYGWFLDASPLRLPHWQEGLINQTEFRHNLLSHVRACSRVVAISQSAAADAKIFFGIPSEKVTYVPCGIFESDLGLKKLAKQIHPVFQRYGLNEFIPIIMVLGVQEPTKNVVNILKALHQVVKNTTSSIQCVFVGIHDGFVPADKFGALIEKLPVNLKLFFVGGVPEEDKVAIMAHSSMLLYPSLWEGFGIPPLEAMAMRVPVVTSDVSSMPEVCKEYAFYCDPYSPNQMAEQILQVLNLNSEAREAHLERAQMYARQWLWAKNAVPLLVEDIKKHRRMA